MRYEICREITEQWEMVDTWITVVLSLNSRERARLVIASLVLMHHQK